MRADNRTGKHAWNPNDPFECSDHTNECCMHCWNGAGGCEWSNALKPVPGWRAEKVAINMTGRGSEENFSYKIHFCPKYIEGDRLSGKRV